MVSAPNIKNMYFHGVKDPVICPMPKVNIPFKVLNNPNVATQIDARVPCSFCVYHILVMTTNPGVIVASKAPRRNLTVARPAKELHAADIIRRPPQIVIFVPRNFAIGNRCIKATPGYSATRYPKKKIELWKSVDKWVEGCVLYLPGP